MWNTNLNSGRFKLLGIDLGLGELKVTFEDLLSAFLGALPFAIAWCLILLPPPKMGPFSGEAADRRALVLRPVHIGPKSNRHPKLSMISWH